LGTPITGIASAVQDVKDHAPPKYKALQIRFERATNK
jgi:hypothetical protein